MDGQTRRLAGFLFGAFGGPFFRGGDVTLQGTNPYPTERESRKTIDSKVTFLEHPGRLTWNIQITRVERKMLFKKPLMSMFHINLPGCQGNVIFSHGDAILNLRVCSKCPL